MLVGCVALRDAPTPVLWGFVKSLQNRVDNQKGVSYNLYRLSGRQRISFYKIIVTGGLIALVRGPGLRPPT